MSLNSSIFTALSIGALLVACGDSGTGGSGGTSSGGGTTTDGGGTTTDGGGTTTDGGGTTTDGGGTTNGGAPEGGATGAVCADLDPKTCGETLDDLLCECFGCTDDCATSDCVCPSCAGNVDTCPDNTCNNDNECDPYLENCNCADCFDHPQCP